MIKLCQDPKEKVTPDPKFSRADTSTSLDTSSSAELPAKDLIMELDAAAEVNPYQAGGVYLIYLNM